MVITKTYTEPPVCEKEILRYAGCKGTPDEGVRTLLEECLEEALPRLSYKVCYVELPVVINEGICDFGCMKVESQNLAKNLQSCEKAILFAATIGVEMDRLIRKYGAISPAKAVMLQALGAERIESLCDAFCAERLDLRPRFSPGYGDLALETQKEIFQILGCSKNIGLSLNDSLLMSPSKSVTAFVGLDAVRDNLASEEKRKINACATCSKADCTFRK